LFLKKSKTALTTIWNFPVRKNGATVCVVKGVRTGFNLILKALPGELSERLLKDNCSDQSKEKPRCERSR
jgi:hypothetical protein